MIDNDPIKLKNLHFNKYLKIEDDEFFLDDVGSNIKILDKS